MERDSKFDCDGYYCVEMLIRSWGHGIDNKTQSLLGELRSIRLQLGKPSPDFGHINRKLDNIERIVQEIPMLPSPFHRESVSLDLLITRRVDQLHQKEFYDSINFQAKLDPNQPIVRANSVWLRRLLDILIDNAIDAMRECIERNVTMSTLVHKQGVFINVSDTGKGINGDLVIQCH